MSLNAEQKRQTSIELKENYRILDFDAEVIQEDLRISNEQLRVILNVGPSVDPTNVWRLRDYMDEKIIEQGKTPVSYSIGSENIYFPYVKDWGK